MKIRRGQLKDAREATNLYRSIWPEDKEKLVMEYFKEKIKKKEILVAIDNNKLVGILGYAKFFWDKIDFIDEVIIDNKYRRKKIAIALIKRLEKESKKRKARRIFSTTEIWNKISIKMHKRLGYKRCGYVDNMWEEGVREIMLSKKIK